MTNKLRGIINRTEQKTEEKFIKNTNFELFSGKIQKKSDFSLNSGNLCLTLQLELRPFGW